MSFNHDFKDRAEHLNGGRKHQHRSGWWLRIPLLLGSLSVIGVVLATTKSNDATLQRTAQGELQNRVSESLNMPETLGKTTSVASQNVLDTNWSSETVQAGDTASNIFSRLNIHSHLHGILENEDAKQALVNIRPGETFKAKLSADGQFERLIYQPNRLTQLNVEAGPEGYIITTVEHPVDTRKVSASVTIDDSMYMDGKKAGLSDNVIMSLFNIYAFDIDFMQDIRRGDKFTAIYEERYLNGEKLKDGPILAAEFTNKGKSYKAYRYTNAKGESDYYDESGRSLRKAFIRTPVKFARISSHFNPKRKHPILHTIRAHKGVDYAAPTGTPIRATGSGKVVFVGSKNGYGKTVILKHGKSYTTLYAHMSKFNKSVKQGSQVSQGQVIGYIGKSGSATGPHLHYEFRVNGAHKNPVTVKLPNSSPLPKTEMARFQEETRQLTAQLSTKSNLVAQK